MILIAASTFVHARDEARRRNLPPARWRWISRPRDIDGVFDCTIIQMHPTLVQHDNYRRLMQELDIRAVIHKIKIEHVWT